MKNQLFKMMRREQLVDMMYIDTNNNITKRRIKLTRVTDDKFVAYCFSKEAKRTFKIANVLAVMPVIESVEI